MAHVVLSDLKLSNVVHHPDRTGDAASGYLDRVIKREHGTPPTTTPRDMHDTIRGRIPIMKQSAVTKTNICVTPTGPHFFVDGPSLVASIVQPISNPTTGINTGTGTPGGAYTSPPPEGVTGQTFDSVYMGRNKAPLFPTTGAVDTPIERHPLFKPLQGIMFSIETQPWVRANSHLVQYGYNNLYKLVLGKLHVQSLGYLEPGTASFIFSGISRRGMALLVAASYLVGIPIFETMTVRAYGMKGSSATTGSLLHSLPITCDAHTLWTLVTPCSTDDVTRYPMVVEEEEKTMAADREMLTQRRLDRLGL